MLQHQQLLRQPRGCLCACLAVPHLLSSLFPPFFWGVSPCHGEEQLLGLNLNTSMAKIWYNQIASIVNFCRQEWEVRNTLFSAPESFILRFLGHSFLCGAALRSLRWSRRQPSAPVPTCAKPFSNLEPRLLQPWSRACRWVADNEGIGAEVKSRGPQPQTACKMRTRRLSSK